MAYILSKDQQQGVGCVRANHKEGSNYGVFYEQIIKSVFKAFWVCGRVENIECITNQVGKCHGQGSSSYNGEKLPKIKLEFFAGSR